MIDSVTPGVASSLETGPTEELFVFQFRLELAIQDLLKNCQRLKQEGTKLSLNGHTDSLAILKL